MGVVSAVEAGVHPANSEAAITNKLVKTFFIVHIPYF
jgi:hypothetical protein